MAKVAEEMRQREIQEHALTQQRHFETTTASTFGAKPHTETTIGRRVMKTQDGQNVSFNNRDEQLIVEHGTWRRL